MELINKKNRELTTIGVWFVGISVLILSILFYTLLHYGWIIPNTLK